MKEGRMNRRVPKLKRPIGWWYHKIMCELGYRFAGSNSDMYYEHLHILCDKYKINLYGDKI
jgi:hypothetical protein